MQPQPNPTSTLQKNPGSPLSLLREVLQRKNLTTTPIPPTSSDPRKLFGIDIEAVPEDLLRPMLRLAADELSRALARLVAYP